VSWTSALKHGHFAPTHDAGLQDPHGTLMDERVMVLLDEAREEAGVPFIVTSSFRSPSRNGHAHGATDSAHLPDAKDGRARAVDGYFLGLSLFEQFLHLVRYPFFALGLYPYPLPGRATGAAWCPIVHVDRKDRGTPWNAKVLWVRDAAGEYVYWPSPEFHIELQAIASASEVTR
jgi:hypothetical protein